MNIVRQKMKDKKITQQELAELVGIPQTSISYLLRQLDEGIINLGRAGRMQKICKVLKISIKDLLRSGK